MCEEFPGLTPAAAEALLDDDGDRVLEIIGLRAYKRAFDAYQNLDGLSDRAKDKVKADPLVQAVILNDEQVVDDDGESDAG